MESWQRDAQDEKHVFRIVESSTTGIGQVENIYSNVVHQFDDAFFGNLELTLIFEIFSIFVKLFL